MACGDGSIELLATEPCDCKVGSLSSGIKMLAELDLEIHKGKGD